MSADDLPTEEQLADDLTKVARNGIGRSLPGKQGGRDIPYLWAAAAELAEDQTEDLPGLIAKVVVPAIRRVEPREEQEALAEILWVDLEADDGYRKDDVPTLAVGIDNRYQRAATKLSTSELHVKNHLRRPLLEKVGRLIVVQLQKHRAEIDTPNGTGKHRRAFEEEPSFPRPDSELPFSVDSLNWLAMVSAELYFACLTALFLPYIHYEKHCQRYRLGEAAAVWGESAEHLLLCYGNFISRRGHGSIIERDLFNTFIKHVPQSVLTTIHAIRNDTRALIPRLTSKQIQVLEERPLPSEKEYQYILHPTWRNWYKDEVVHHDSVESFPPTPTKLISSDQPLGIELLAAKAGEVERLLSAHLEYPEPFLTNARGRAHKRLGYYFDVEDWERSIEGHSLREHADMFFDREMVRLANPDLVWFDSR